MVRLRERLRKPVLFLIGALLCLFTAPGVFSEGDLSLELGLSNLIMQTRETDGDKYWAWMPAGNAGFSFKSSGNKNVKADLAFSFASPEMDISAAAGAPAGTIITPLLSLDRAYVKARFPWFRITAGKTRLGWGDGFVFNSGDVIFGSTDTSVDLTASEVRAETTWLSAVNIPLGRFTFIEGIILPPEADTASGEIFGAVDNISGGGRIYTKAAGIKIEGGYLFDQRETNSDAEPVSVHKPYLSLQGNLIADWYLSSSVSLPVSGDIKQSAEDSFNLSAGIFHMVQLNSISSMTFRLEGLYKPFHSWLEEVRKSGEPKPSYALLLYPEISYTPTDTVNLSIRTIWSPVDMSAMITAGAGWNVFEGFDLSCYAVFNAGDPDDSFAWNRDDSLWKAGADAVDSMAVMMGINYIY